MNDLPLSLNLCFLLTALLTLGLLGLAVRGSRSLLGGAVAWIVLQSAIALSGFYLVTNTLPPRLALAVVPPLLLIAGLFLTPAGKHFLDSMDLRWSVLLHTVRILVELNLYWLFLYRQVPALMTFEAGNVDLLVGLTAPLIWWAFQTHRIGRRSLLVWNGLALLSVLNAVARALLSAPFRFQRFAYDQPTIAILEFPFVLLPAFIVPVTILCHLVVFRKLLGGQRDGA